MPTFTASIIQSADDAHQGTTITGATTSITGATQNLSNASASGVTQWDGWRWQSVTVPASATVSACTVTLNYTTAGGSDSISYDFENSNNPIAFSTANSNISNRTRVGHAVSQTAAGSTGAHATPDMTTSVTAVLAISGWASGNAMAVHSNETTNTATNSVSAWDATSSSVNTALLSITYTTGGGPTAQPAFLLRLIGL